MASELFASNKATSPTTTSSVATSSTPSFVDSSALTNSSHATSDSNESKHDDIETLVRDLTRAVKEQIPASTNSEEIQACSVPGSKRRTRSETDLLRLTIPMLDHLISTSGESLVKPRIQKVMMFGESAKGGNKTVAPVKPSDTNSQVRHLCPHPQCDKHFSTSGYARRHSRIHEKIRAYHCPHPDCKATFTRKDNCRQHQRKRHSFSF